MLQLGAGQGGTKGAHVAPASGIAASVVPVQAKLAVPTFAGIASLAMPLAPLAVTGTVAVQVWPPTVHVRLSDAQLVAQPAQQYKPLGVGVPTQLEISVIKHPEPMPSSKHGSPAAAVQLPLLWLSVPSVHWNTASPV